MSEDSKGKPPTKLKLSRDLKANAGSEAAETSPAIKLKPKQTEEKPKAVEEKPKATPQVVRTAPIDAPSTTEDAPSTPRPQDVKPAFDPKNPFGDRIKKSEVETTNHVPSEQTPERAPTIKHESGSQIEAAINSLNSREQPAKAKSGIVPSLIIIFILLIVLFAAAYGLWKLLQPSSKTEYPQEEAAVSSQQNKTAETTPQTPIEQAKNTIARVSVADVDMMTSQSPDISSSDSDKPEAANLATSVVTDSAPTVEKSTAQVAEVVLEAPPEGISDAIPMVSEVALPDNSAIETSKQNVSAFLSSIHIGGLRRGDRPMVIIEGKSYHPGDVVQDDTKLKFDGLRNGRLAFRDQHGIIYLKSF